MTFSGTVSVCFACVGNLGDGSMALLATEFTVRRSEKLFFINVEYLDPILFLEPYKSRILMAGETAFLIQAKALTRAEKQEIPCKDY
jgi:hypothetical protein